MQLLDCYSSRNNNDNISISLWPQNPHESFYLVCIKNIYQLRMALGDELNDNPVDPMHEFVSDVGRYFYDAKTWLSLQQQMTEGKKKSLSTHLTKMSLMQ